MDNGEGFIGITGAICIDHIIDTVLADRVRGTLHLSTCSYCGRSPVPESEPFAVSMDRVGQIVFDAASWFYRAASSEYFEEEFFSLYETDEVVADVAGGVFDPDVERDVLEQIAGAIETPAAWVDSRLLDEFLFSWESFANTVKYESRFVFVGRDGRPRGDDEPPARLSRFLDGLNAYVQDGMISEVNPGDTLYRARMIQAESLVRDAEVDPAKHLGPAPAGTASAGRLNPEGVGLFYAATTAELAVKETALHSLYDEALVGGFKVKRRLAILDFTKRPELPSIFDCNQRREYVFARFADEFVERLTQTIRLTGEERVEYVVTQVVGEYFRWIPTIPLDGIAWNSHLVDEDETGKNVLVWASAADVQSEPPPPNHGSRSELWSRSFGAHAPTMTLAAGNVERHRVSRGVRVQVVGLLGDVDDPDPIVMGP